MTRQRIRYSSKNQKSPVRPVSEIVHFESYGDPCVRPTAYGPTAYGPTAASGGLRRPTAAYGGLRQPDGCCLRRPDGCLRQPTALPTAAGHRQIGRSAAPPAPKGPSALPPSAGVGPLTVVISNRASGCQDNSEILGYPSLRYSLDYS